MKRHFSTFYLNEKLFGVNVLLVKEIKKCLEIMPVAGAPSFVSGLLNLRGQIIIVIDPRVKLGLPRRMATSQTKCMVLKTIAELKEYKLDERLDDETDMEMVGLLVDRIGDIVMVDDSDIRSVPANLGSIEGRYLSGVVPFHDELMVLIKVKELLVNPHS